MSRPRMIVGVAGVVLVVAALAWTATGLPAFGHYNHAYGRVVARSTVHDRQATNAVTLTTFDYRGFDTLGEEFILFISVVGVVVLLRRMRGETDEEGSQSSAEARDEDLRASTGERWLGAVALAPVAVLSVYVIVHGALTPGGGFQGGVILMAAATFLALGGESALLLRLRRSSSPLEIAEATGAAGFTIIGFGGLIAGGTFFWNFIDHGQSGSILSAGVLPLDNISVGLEVAGALLMVTSELFDQRMRHSR